MSVECVVPNYWIVRGCDGLRSLLSSISGFVFPSRLWVVWSESDYMRPVVSFYANRVLTSRFCLGVRGYARWFGFMRPRLYTRVWVTVWGCRPTARYRSLFGEDVANTVYGVVVDTLGSVYGVRGVYCMGGRERRVLKVRFGRDDVLSLGLPWSFLLL